MFVRFYNNGRIPIYVFETDDIFNFVKSIKKEMEQEEFFIKPYDKLFDFVVSCLYRTQHEKIRFFENLMEKDSLSYEITIECCCYKVGFEFTQKDRLNYRKSVLVKELKGINQMLKNL